MKWVTHPSADDFHLAAMSLREENLVAFATETVYGLGADCFLPLAVEKIYRIKQRPKLNPLIVHIHPDAELDYFTNGIHPTALRLIKAFWPGPLTIVLPKSKRIPAIVTSGQSSVALRAPNHPVALGLLKAMGPQRSALVAPSANTFTRLSPTVAEHVYSAFEGQQTEITYLLDGGACEWGVESTILDLTQAEPSLLRYGSISVIEIEKCLERPVQREKNHNSPRAPGQHHKHYSPLTLTQLIDTEQLTQLKTIPSDWGLIRFSSHLKSSAPIYFNYMLILPPDEPDYARQLYAALHTLDRKNLKMILIERPPKEWLLVWDRLSRATSGDFSSNRLQL